MEYVAKDVRVGDRIVIDGRVCGVTDIRPPFMGYVQVRAGGWRMDYLPTARVVLVDRRGEGSVWT